MSDPNELLEQVTPDWDAVPAALPEYDLAAVLELDLYLRGSYLASLLPAAWFSAEAAWDFFRGRQDVAQSVMSFLVLVFLFSISAVFLAQRPLHYKLVAVALELAGGVFFSVLAYRQRAVSPGISLWFLCGVLSCLPGLLGIVLHFHYLRQAAVIVLPESCRGLLGRPFGRRRLVARLRQPVPVERTPASGAKRPGSRPFRSASQERP